MARCFSSDQREDNFLGAKTMKRKKYEHRRQHFVPACYLKALAGSIGPEDKQVHAVRVAV